MKISINIPSYKRPIVETLKYIPFARVWIDGEEEEEYRKENPNTDIVVVDKGIQGNICRIRNYILKKEFERGMDFVCTVDDDMEGMYCWQDQVCHKIPTEMIMVFLEKYSIMAEDLGVYLWGMNINQDKQVYREYSPFSMTSFIGAPFTVFRKGKNCWFYERLPLKEDYDMTL